MEFPANVNGVVMEGRQERRTLLLSILHRTEQKVLAVDPILIIPTGDGLIIVIHCKEECHE